jgi:menaquinone-dependent protoporphyrinogen oxidase
MENVLLLYSSTDGQTVKILKHIANELGEESHCQLQDLHQTKKVEWSRYDRVLIGAAIRYGHFHPLLYRFIHRNKDALGCHKVGFFCVNLTARTPEKSLPENSTYMQKFLQKSPWKPELQAVFAGALRYPSYRWFDRVMIQFIMRMTGGETDKTKEIEYTDWQKVSEFAHRFQNM